MQNEGLLLIDKEKGITSFRLVSILRKILGVQKIGHAGTLDPLATGLMILLIGKRFTTKSASFLNLDKTYEAILFLGKSTTTYDHEGDITASSSYVPSEEEVDQALFLFQGNITQVPPMFSAKKVEGKKLYELARQGLSIPREKISVNVKIHKISYQYPFLHLLIDCSKGTYIRSLAHDIGRTLKTEGYLLDLKRERIGSFHLKDAIPSTSLSLSSIQERLIHA